MEYQASQCEVWWQGEPCHTMNGNFYRLFYWRTTLHSHNTSQARISHETRCLSDFHSAHGQKALVSLIKFFNNFCVLHIIICDRKF